MKCGYGRNSFINPGSPFFYRMMMLRDRDPDDTNAAHQSR